MSDLGNFKSGAGYVSSKTAATSFGVTNDYIARLCKSGKLRAVRDGRAWMIETDSLQSFFGKELPAGAVESPLKIYYKDTPTIAVPRTPVAPISSNPAVIAICPPEFRPRATFFFVQKQTGLFVVRGVVLGVLVLGIGAMGYGSLSVGAPIAARFSQVAAAETNGFLSGVTSFFYNLFNRDSGTAPTNVAQAVAEKQPSVVPQTPKQPIQQQAQQPVQQPVQQQPNVAQTIINNPVVERIIERERVVSSGGITAAYLQSNLDALDTKLQSLIFATSASAASGNAAVYNVVAQTNRIDTLEDVDITGSLFKNGRIVDSTFENVSVSLNGTTTSSGGFNIADGCYAVDGICISGGGSANPGGSDGNVQFNDGGALSAVATFSFSTSSDRLVLTNASTTNLSIAGGITGAGLASCSGSLDKIQYDSTTRQFVCAADQTGGGGGSDTNWSFFNNSGLRPATSTNQVLIGGLSTTTSAKLQVIGGAQFDNATSSSINTNLLGIGGASYFLSLTGNGLSNIAGTLTVNQGQAFSTTSVAYWDSTQARWATTSSEYWKSQTNFFSTSSADFWKTENNFFSTTSASAFLALNQGNAFSTTSVTYFAANGLAFSTTSSAYFLSQNGGAAFSTTSAAYNLSTYDKGYFFSTTSVNYWEGTQNRWATTSAQYFLSQNQGLAFSTSSASFFSAAGLAFSTSSSNFYSSVGLAFSTTSAQYFLSQNSGNAFSTSSAAYHLSTYDKGSFFSTTSVAYWDSTQARWATSSSDYWKLQNNFYSTSSADYWLTTKSLSAFSTTSADYWKTQNNFHSTSSFAFNLSTYDTGYFFSTTSVAYWDSTQFRWATTSSDAWLATKDKGYFFSTTSASVYLALNQGNAFSTTSANFWSTVGLSFSTSSASYFLSQNQGNAFSSTSALVHLGSLDKGFFFSTTSSDHWLTTKSLSAFSTSSADYWKTQNNFHSTSSFAFNLSTYDNGSFFSTTSVNYWEGTQNRWATTSAQYFLSQNQGLAFSTSSTNFYSSVGLAFSSSSASYFLSQNTGGAFSTTSANYYVNASTTIPKTYTNNTFLGTNSFANITAAGATTTSLTTDVASTTLLLATGATTTHMNVSGTFAGAGLISCSGAGDKLIWNSTTRQFGCGADAGAGGGITALGAQYSTFQTGSSQTFATSSDTNIALTITSSGDTHTFAPSWVGTLAATRGGTGLSSISEGSLLIGGAGNTWTQIATSSLGLGHSTSSFAYNLSTYDKGYFFSTTSVNYWEGTQSRWATTSAQYFLSQNQGIAFSTSSASFFASAGLAYSTTSANFYSSVGLAFSTTSAQYFLSQNDSSFSTSSALFFSSVGLAHSTTSVAYQLNQTPVFTNGFISQASSTFAGLINIAATNATSTLATFSGQSFITASTTGFNTGFGLNALSSLTGGNLNTAFGFDALSRATSSPRNTAIGYRALANTVDSNGRNVAVGYLTLSTQTSGSQNTALGYSTAANLTTGSSNVGIGSSALSFLSSGSQNVAVGSNALQRSGAGSSTVAIGFDAAAGTGTYTTQGVTAVGTRAGVRLSADSDFNTLIGYNAGGNITNGARNILLGASEIANNLTTGYENIGIGNTIFFPSATSNQSLNIGGLIFGSLPATSTGWSLPTSGTIGIGTTSPTSRFGIALNNGGTLTTAFEISSSTANSTTTLFSVSNTGSTTISNGINISAGCFAVNGTCLSGGVADGTFSTTSASYFSSLGLAFSTTSSNYWSSVGLGFSTTSASVFLANNTGAAFSTTSALYFSSVGLAHSTTSVAYQLTQTPVFTSGFTAYASSTIGNGTATDGLTISGGATTTGDSYFTGNLTTAGVFNFTPTLGTSTFLKYNNVPLLTASSTAGNFSFGLGALRSVSSGIWNVALGESALRLNTTGSSNVAVGRSAFSSITSATNSVAIGTGAGQGIGTYTAEGLTLVGYAAGINFGSNNSYNTMIGHSAGSSMITGQSNILVGANVGGSGNLNGGYGNVGIANNQYFPVAAGSNQLNIGNLIFGSLPATSTGFVLPTSGTIGIGTSSPTSRFGIALNAGGTLTTAFEISSSTANSTTTLFSISNTGSTTISNGVNITAGCFAVNGSCLSSGVADGTFSTTSAAYFSSLGLSFSTTSNNYWSSVGLGFSTTSASVFLANNTGAAFSTTSALFFSSVGLGHSTTSVAYQLNQTPVFTNGFISQASSTFTSLLNLGARTSTSTLVTFAGDTFVVASTTGSNVGFGLGSLKNITSGGSNVAIGNGVMLFATSTSGNTAVGSTAGAFRYSATGNTALGDCALCGWTSGNYNVAIGSYTMASGGAGNYNIAIGSGAIGGLATGGSNIAIGRDAMVGAFETVFRSNIAIGDYALNGADNESVGNIAMGYQTLWSAGSALNTAIGYQSGMNVTSGYGNLILGASSTNSLTTGSANIVLGNHQTLPAANTSNMLNIGGLIFGSLPATSTGWSLPTSGTIGIGTTSPTSIFGISANNGNTLRTLFQISSSTNNSTSTLFSINNTGQVLIGGSAATTSTLGIGQLAVLPSTTTVVRIATTTQTGTGFGKAIQGNYLYIAGFATTNGFEIFDISNPSSPTRVGQGSFTNNGIGVAVQGRYAYTVENAAQDTFKIWDISNPSLPIQLSQSSMTQTASSIKVSGNYAYLVSGNSGVNFEIWDVSNPYAPKRVSANSLSSFGRNVVIQGRYAYFANNASSFEIWDVANPAAPIRVSLNVMNVNGRAIYVQGRYAYLVGSGGLNSFEIWDVSNPAAPVRSSINTIASSGSGGQDVFVQGRYAYVTGFCCTRNFEVWDVSSSTAAFRVALNSTNNTPNILVQGRYAYLTNTTLEVWDLGGSYVSQFEAGGIETGTLAVRNNLTAMDGSFQGGLNIVNSLNLGGAFTLNAFNNSTTTAGQNYSIFSVGTASSTAITGNSTTSIPFLNISYSGNIGVGTTSNLAKFSIQNNYGSTNMNLFEISSSTSADGNAQSSIFSISQTGSTTAANGFNITAGCYAINGTCLTSGGSSASSTLLASDTNTFTNLTTFLAGVRAFASSTIGNGTATGGLTISGGATTTGLSKLSGGILSLASSTIGNGTRTSGLTISGGATTTGVAVYSSGSAAAPGIAFSANNGTGLYYTAPSGFDTLNIAAEGSQIASFNTIVSTIYTALTVNSSLLASVYYATPGSSASVVSYGFNDTADYGFFSPSSDTLGFSTNGIDRLRITSAGNVGIGSTTPLSKLSVQKIYGDTASNIFAVASSTSANGSTGTPFLSVASSGFGTTTVTGLAISGSATSTSNVGFNITGGCYAINLTCISSGGSSAFAWTPTTSFGIAANATSTVIGFNAGLYSLASSTIGGGTQTTGLTILGGATTTGNTYLGGSVSIVPQNTATALDVSGTLTVGVATSTGRATLGSWTLGVANNSFWINMPTTAGSASGIGSGGAGVNAWIAYAGAAGNWFTNAAVGDIAYRNQGGRILFGNTTGNSSMTLASDRYGFGTVANATTRVQIAGTTAFDPFEVASSTGSAVGQSYLRVTQAGNIGIGTSTPYAKLSLSANAGDTNTTLFAISSTTSGTGTTTLFSISNTGALTQLGGASSTFSNGFNITSGCFAINGSCVGGAGGSGTVSSGLAGQFAFYNANGTTVSGTSSLMYVSEGSFAPTSSLAVRINSYTDGIGNVADGANGYFGSGYSDEDGSTFGGSVSLLTGGVRIPTLGSIYVHDYSTGSFQLGETNATVSNDDSDVGASGPKIEGGGGGVFDFGQTVRGGTMYFTGGTAYATSSNSFSNGINAGGFVFQSGSASDASHIAGEAYFALNGGRSPSSNQLDWNGGDIYLAGGSGSVGDVNGGSVFITSGLANGSGTRGKIYLDAYAIDDNVYDGGALTVDPMFGRVGIGTTSPSAQLEIFAHYDRLNADLFKISSSSPDTGTTTLFKITNKGYVGIGTSTPVSALHVKGLFTLEDPYQRMATIQTISNDVGGGLLSFSANGTNNIVAEFNDCCNYILRLSQTDGESSFHYNLGVEQNLRVMGTLGVGTSTPDSKFAVQKIYGDTKSSIFSIASSTSSDGSAGTVLFAVGSTGSTTAANGFNITNGCYAVNGICLTTGGGAASTTILSDANTWSGLATFSSGLRSFASSTIGNGTQIGGLTISGGATTTGNALTLGSATAASFNATSSTNAATTGYYINGISGVIGSSTRNNFDFGGATSSSVSLGGGNYAIGYGALGNSTTTVGSNADNFAAGRFALQGSTTAGYRGSYNIAIGPSALRNNSGGSNNVAFGFSALQNNMTGHSNFAVGDFSLFNNVTGGENIALGSSALISNSSGSFNVALNSSALLSNTTGRYNNAVGYFALSSNTSGTNNTGIGLNAGRNITTGYSNLMLGDNTQTSGGITTGSGNIGIGANTFFASQAADRQLNIGNLIFGSLPATTTVFSLPTSGTIGIGTTSPISKFAISLNSGDTVPFAFLIASSTANSTSTLFSITNTGRVGIGTSSPYAKLSVVGDVVADTFSATSTTATSTFSGGLNVGNGAIVYDYSSGQTSIQSLALGNMSIDADSGMVTWNDMPVTSAASYGTAESYTAAIDGNSMLTVYGESDGAGGVIRTGVGVGTTTPSARLAVDTTNLSSSTLAFVIGSSTRNFLTVSNSGNGTTTVAGLAISGTATSTSNVGFNITSGCYAVNGTCLTAGGSSASSTLLSDVNTFGGNTIFTQSIGLGTTTPYGKLAISTAAQQAGEIPLLNIASTTNASLFMVLGNGRVGIGTTTPIAALALPFGTTAANGISFGGDTQANLYRSGAGVVMSDGEIRATQFRAGSSMIFSVGYITDTGVGTNFRAAPGASGSFMLNIGANNADTHTSGVGGALRFAHSVFAGHQFQPTSGTGDWYGIYMQPLLNQSGTATGLTRGMYLALPPVAAYDYRALEIATTTVSISNASAISNAYNVLVHPTTYTSSSTSLYTLTNASTLNLAGAPIGTTASTTITNSTALLIQGNALTNVTNGTGLIVNAPTGATRNFAAQFLGGNVGVGTSTPFAPLSVASGTVSAFNGAICADDGGNTKCYGTLTPGVVYGDSSSFVASDLAEQYQSSDPTLVAGEIVTLDMSTSTTVKRAVYGDKPLGIVSTQPGVLLGDETPNSVPLALAGRVPLVVSNEGGAIRVGDAISLSTIAGIGTKATTTGYTVGTALESFEGTGTSTILVFVQTGYTIQPNLLRSLSLESTSTPTAIAEGAFASASVTLRSAVSAIQDAIVRSFSAAIYATSGIFEKIFAKEVHTDKLCVSDSSGETCITKAQLDFLIAGAAGSIPPSQEPVQAPPENSPEPEQTPEPSSEPVVEESPDTSPEPSDILIPPADEVLTPIELPAPSEELTE